MSEANGFELLLRALLVIEVDVGSPRQAVTLVSLETRRFDPGRSPCYSSGLPPDNRGHCHVRSASSAHLNPRRDYRPTTADTLMFAPRAPLTSAHLLSESSNWLGQRVLAPQMGVQVPLPILPTPFDRASSDRTDFYAVTAGAVMRFQTSSCKVQSFVAAPTHL